MVCRRESYLTFICLYSLQTTSTLVSFLCASGTHRPDNVLKTYAVLLSISIIIPFKKRKMSFVNCVRGGQKVQCLFYSTSMIAPPTALFQMLSPNCLSYATKPSK